MNLHLNMTFTWAGSPSLLPHPNGDSKGQASGGRESDLSNEAAGVVFVCMCVH